MKKICYSIKQKHNIGTDESPKYKTKIISGYSVLATESALAAQIEFVKREAYNGTYTIEEIPDEPKQQISNLKQQLADTDYKAIKYAEGWITEEEYAPVKAERQAIRDEINKLEATI